MEYAQSFLHKLNYGSAEVKAMMMYSLERALQAGSEADKVRRASQKELETEAESVLEVLYLSMFMHQTASPASHITVHKLPPSPRT
jgi:hypothetical protein